MSISNYSVERNFENIYQKHINAQNKNLNLFIEWIGFYSKCLDFYMYSVQNGIALSNDNLKEYFDAQSTIGRFFKFSILEKGSVLKLEYFVNDNNPSNHHFDFHFELVDNKMCESNLKNIQSCMADKRKLYEVLKNEQLIFINNKKEMLDSFREFLEYFAEIKEKHLGDFRDFLKGEVLNDISLMDILKGVE